MTGYRVQRALPAHIGALPAIERAAAEGFPDRLLPLSSRGVVQPTAALAAAQAEGRLWVALSLEQEPVGFALAEIAGEIALLTEVDVHPNHQRQGLGRALVEAVIAWAQQAGVEALTLTTFASLPWNAPFYERLGFRRLDRTALEGRLAQALQEEARRGLQDRVAMRLDLGAI
ncbi:MAG: GNAT family N-acetyltransferase [Bacteroidota bacterium]